MIYLRHFLKFKESAAVGETEVKPDKTKVKPATRPGKPSPFPTKKPGKDDLGDPRAELPQSTEDEVINKFKEIVNKDNIDLKKYFPEV